HLWRLGPTPRSEHRRWLSPTALALLSPGSLPHRLTDPEQAIEGEAEGGDEDDGERHGEQFGGGGEDAEADDEGGGAGRRVGCGERPGDRCGERDGQRGGADTGDGDALLDDGRVVGEAEQDQAGDAGQEGDTVPDETVAGRGGGLAGRLEEKHDGRTEAGE